MSRKRKKPAEEGEDEEHYESNDRLGEFIGTGLIFVVGLWILYISNWNFILLSLGSLFTLSPVLQIPAVRIYINSKTGHQIFSVSQSQISDSNIIGSAREVHIHEATKTIIRETSPGIEREKKAEDWEVDEEFTLKPEEDEDWRDFEFDLEGGEELIGSIETDGGDVNCYVLGRASFRSFRDDEDFNPYWAKQAVTKTMVSFPAPGSRKYFFVVVSDEEDEDVSVTVRLNVKS